MKKILGLLLLALMAPMARAQEATNGPPTITIIQLSGGIDSAYAGFLRGELRRAEREHDLAVVIRLSGSGSVGIDADALAAALRDVTVPVATWVGPSGRATRGLATVLWLHGDLRLVAPGAVVGRFNPLEIGAAPSGTARVDPVLAPLDHQDMRANELVERGIASGTAGTLFEAVRALDGKTLKGRTLDVDTALDAIRFARPGPVVASRHALATNPTLVYLLLLTGIAAIVFELFQPGFGPAGYAGGLLVALAAYGLLALPTSPLGLALVLLGVGGMAADVRRNELTFPTWVGAVALAAGSWLLVRTHGPALRPATWSIAFGVVGSLVFYGVVMTVVLRALRGQAGQIGQALVGRSGEVRSTLNPQGHVLVEGALWRARALEWDGPVAAGTPVRVTAVDEQALILDVEPFERG
jgi:membrane-bound serine protease (ClpP class)